jgi:hypothetical protein
LLWAFQSAAGDNLRQKSPKFLKARLKTCGKFEELGQNQLRALTKITKKYQMDKLISSIAPPAGRCALALQ